MTFTMKDLYLHLYSPRLEAWSTMGLALEEDPAEFKAFVQYFKGELLPWITLNGGTPMFGQVIAYNTLDLNGLVPPPPKDSLHDLTTFTDVFRDIPNFYTNEIPKFRYDKSVENIRKLAGELLRWEKLV